MARSAVGESIVAARSAHEPLPWAGRVFVIAEAGVNHDGDIEKARRLIDAAADIGADAVKFQTWNPGELTGRFAVKASYATQGTRSDESFVDMEAARRLPFEAFRELQAHAARRKILFLSTPDGFESLNFLANDLKVPILKVGSSEVTHTRFLAAVGAKGRPVVLSTGLSTLGEAEAAVGAVRAGGDVPLVVLHCTSEYPAPDADMNLRAMTALGAAIGVPVGLSDHSLGIEAAVAATALGARVIEKHLTLDRTLPGPDHAASATPAEFAQMVRAIRRVEVQLGDGIKRRMPSELKNLIAVRRSVVAACDLAAGTRLEPGMLACKRPGSGIAPEHLDAIVGMVVNKSLKADEPITWDCLR